MIYDMVLAPLYKTNQSAIDNLSKHIEKLFNKNSEALKQKVATSAGDSKWLNYLEIKGFMGEVMLGVLNPVQKKAEKDTSDNKEDD